MNKRGIIILFVVCSNLLRAQQPSVIPQPVDIKMAKGNFIIDNNIFVKYNATQKELKATADFFVAYIKNISGITLPVNKPSKKPVEFIIEKSIIEEGYKLNVSPSSIVIKAGSYAGFFYAIQSLLQTLPQIRTNQSLQVPCMSITDYPRFKWRGMHLDVSRHFFSAEVIKQYIDLMAVYKMNRFHWHLTDGGGWRLEIKKYPKLTQQAAWRVEDWGKPWNWGEVEFNADRNKATYGGYYTQEQAREIVAYAKARNITVVPEIEMPGHSEAAMAAYPELSCNPVYHFGQPGNFYGNKVESNFCAGNDNAFNFIQDVLTEVINIFPSAYIHVGGDEVDKASWKKCVKCQARMKAEGLKNENELQSYFIKRIEKFIIGKKRKMIGWDEILEGGLAPEATVMSWRGEAGGIEAAKMKHDVVMTPGSPCYFDHYQAGPEGEPLAIGGFNTLKKVYDYEPIPKELNEAESKYVLGAQGNLWTEYISTAEHVEYMVLPRMPALAEVLWTPKENKNWNNFNERLQYHFIGYEQKGIHYCAGNFTVSIKPVAQNGQLLATLFSEVLKGEIRYTTDGTDPTVQAIKYNQPIAVQSSVTIKASVLKDGKIMGVQPAKQSFVMHKALGKDVVYANPVSKYYLADGPNSLTDGIKGNNAAGKYWHGFNEKDMIAIVDLGEAKSIQSISLGCLQKYNDWIFLPQSVKFEISADGNIFSEIKTLNNPIDINQKNTIYDFTATFIQQAVRFVRVTAKNNLCPAGHSNAGKPGWIFADELTID